MIFFKFSPFIKYEVPFSLKPNYFEKCNEMREEMWPRQNRQAVKSVKTGETDETDETDKTGETDETV